MFKVLTGATVLLAAIFRLIMSNIKYEIFKKYELETNGKKIIIRRRWQTEHHHVNFDIMCVVLPYAR